MAMPRNPSPAAQQGNQPPSRRERLTLVMRSLSGDADLEVEIGEGAVASVSAGKAVLPAAAADDSSALIYQESCGDMIAVRHAHHDPALHQRHRPAAQSKHLTAISQRVTSANAPTSAKLAKELPSINPAALHDSMEHLRLSLLGGRRLAGLASRSPYWWQRQLPVALSELKTDAASAHSLVVPHTANSIAVALWRSMCEQQSQSRRPTLPPAPHLTHQPDLPGERPDLRQLLIKLQHHIDDQAAFASTVQEIFTALTAAPTDTSGESRQDESEQSSSEETQSAPAQEGDSDAQQPDSTGDDEEEPREMDGEAQRDVATPILMSSDDTQGEEASPENDEPMPYQPPDSTGSAGGVYRAYTTEYDEIASASTLVESEEELIRLRSALDKQWGAMQDSVAPLAARLQRVLLTPTPETWESNLDDGYIDPARLARVPVKPTRPGIFRRRKEIKERDVSVTLLLDNSGSMRGYPIRIAALCAELLARTLERCKIRSEVLGYTTKAWKGGESYLKWKNGTRHHNPGRLNDLLHIIYKGESISWQHARPRLALMLRENLLKENVDGEALQWALSRLRKHAERRRILIVISDGAPVDDMTLSYNPPDYLDKHLQAVTSEIEKSQQCELVAIGIGYDVGRFYRNAVRIPDADSLAAVLMNELINRFKTPAAQR